ncbi:something about silencing protein 10-like [Anopheles nili]|uniref:something about silencing protein 10-like n=1 Tax=Anopheles nili TaxID=185578 RepID=UPI00237A17D8|nr:something about silencing protein 10-like [Anopheles nili]
MPDKIKFGDIGSDYEPSLSEDEYSEGEKELLKKVRRKRRDEYDEDDDIQQHTVLGFDDDDEYYDDEEEEEPDFEEIRKFEHDSDIDDKDAEDDLPDRHAWGSKAGAFYGTGYVDRDYDTLTAQEEELARLEEEEAMEMQKRLMRNMTEADYMIDDWIPASEQEKLEQSKGKEGKLKKKKQADIVPKFSSKDEIVIHGDLSGLSEREQLELFRKTSPEFEGLVHECSVKLSECVNVLEPVLELLKKHNKLSHPLGQLLTKRYQFFMLYCNNISFYVLLKSLKVEIRHHPLVKRLLQLKSLVQEMEQKYEQSAKSQVEKLLEAQAQGLEITFADEDGISEANPKATRRLKVVDRLEQEAREESPSADGASQASDEGGDSDGDEFTAKRMKLDANEDNSDMEPEDGEGEEMDVDGKRKITYQMAKNKGLSVRKRKDQRNIRVKNKLKYRKALIRRKGSVRQVRTETTRYSGETSIKPFVKRGIKIK